MTARCVISPVINPTPNAQAPKAEQYCELGSAHYYAIGIDGRVTLPWCLTLGRSADWTLADADVQIESLFTVPAGVNTRDELRAWLQGVTVADMSGAQRTKLQTILDNHSINRADFTLQTTGAQIMRRILSTLQASDMNQAVLSF